MSVQRLVVVPLADDGDGARLALHGDLDAYSVRLLARELDALRRAGQVHVCLDTAGLTFMDSTGLHVLVEQQQAFDAAGGRLVLDRPSVPVRRLLEVAAVDGFGR